MSNLKPRPTDDLYGVQLDHECLHAYDWGTRVRVTTDYQTIDQIVDVIDAPVNGTWCADAVGLYVYCAPEREERLIRPYAVQRFDARVWDLLLGHASARDEVEYARVWQGEDVTASDIAEGLLHACVDVIDDVCRALNCDVDDVRWALERELRSAGAPL